VSKRRERRGGRDRVKPRKQRNEEKIKMEESRWKGKIGDEAKWAEGKERGRRRECEEDLRIPILFMRPPQKTS
jgi:hypothetical protein